MSILGVLLVYISYIRISKKLCDNYITEDDKWAPYVDQTKVPDSLEQEIVTDKIEAVYKPIYTPSESTSPPCTNDIVSANG